MEFIINYWAILLVALILVLLVILAYLIDKKNRKLKEVENYQVKDEKKIENNVDLNINVEDKKLSSIDDGEKLNDIKPLIVLYEVSTLSFGKFASLFSFLELLCFNFRISSQ